MKLDFVVGEDDMKPSEALASNTLTILCPGVGEVQFPIDEDASTRTGVAEKHANLTVLDTPRRITVLALNVGRMLPFLDESRLIED